MHIRLSELRAECASQPFLLKVIRICAVTRQVSLTRFAWCQRKMGGYYTRESFKELLFAFQALERSGFGRILQGSQRARARFQWVVMPVTVERALGQPGQEILPTEVLPEAAALGFSLPPPEVVDARPGWTRHEVTLRPGELAELWVPDDLTLPEASWLGAYLQRLSAGTADTPAQPE